MRTGSIIFTDIEPSVFFVRSCLFFSRDTLLHALGKIKLEDQSYHVSNNKVKSTAYGHEGTLDSADLMI